MQLHRIDHLYQKGSKKNQEDFLWPDPSAVSLQDRIFIVCDGVGGSENGEIASRLVAENMGKGLQAALARGASIDAAFVNELLETASAHLMDYAGTNGLHPDMATTFTLLLLGANRCFICWCGDSRVYQVRKGEVIFQTEDHSLVQSLIKSGELSEEEARFHPQKNLLLRAVRADGKNPDAEGRWISDIRDGDFFLLCSDGLLENIGPAELHELLANPASGSLAKEFERLCEEKTKDNYSMYLVQVALDASTATSSTASAHVASPTATSGVATSGSRSAATTDTFPAALAGSSSHFEKPSRKFRWLSLLLSVLLITALFIWKQGYFKPQDKNINLIQPVNKNQQDTAMQKAQPSDTAPHNSQAPQPSDTAIIKPRPAHPDDTIEVQDAAMQSRRIRNDGGPKVKIRRDSGQ